MHRRQLLEPNPELGSESIHVDVCLHEQVPHAAATLVEQRHQQMVGLDELVVATHRKALRVGERHLEFGG